MDRRHVMQIATGALSLVAFKAKAAERAAAASAAVSGRTPEEVARASEPGAMVRQRLESRLLPRNLRERLNCMAALKRNFVGTIN